MKDTLSQAIAEDKRNRPKVYKEISDETKAAAITADVANKAKSLLAVAERGRVDFSNLSDVKRRTMEYLEGCKEAAAIPSVLGLASLGYGISRQALYDYLNKHAGTASAEFIEQVRDLLADILCSAALRRDADNSTAIFILKNSHGFSDKIEVTPTSDKSPVDEIDEIALQRRIMGSVVVDED